MDIKRAICHETGHAVVGLHLGFRVDSIKVFQGVPRSLIALDCSRRAMIVLSSGVAAEQLELGSHDADASVQDQTRIAECDGGALDTYVKEAYMIIRSHEQCVRRLREQLTKNWIANQAEAEASCDFNADSESLNFELLSQDELATIWSQTESQREPNTPDVQEQ